MFFPEDFLKHPSNDIPIALKLEVRSCQESGLCPFDPKEVEIIDFYYLSSAL